MKGAKQKIILPAILIIITFIITSLVLVSATATSDNVRAETGDNASAYIWLEVTENNLEILPSKTITYELLVHNFGNESITYYPPTTNEYKIPINWTLSFYPNDELVIPANKYYRMLVDLTAPSNANANTIIEFQISGSTSNPDAVIIAAELRAEVSQTYRTNIIIAEKITFTSPTKQENFVITVQNQGNGDDHLSLEITGIPTGLTLSAEAEKFIIGPGDTEYYTFTLFPSSILVAGNYDLNISLYRINRVSLVNEWVSSHKLVIEIKYYPDLFVTYGDVELSTYNPYVDEEVTINITIHNQGDSDARDFQVDVTPKTGPGSKFDTISSNIDFIGLDKSKTINLTWKPESQAIKWLIIEIDPDNKIRELNESNNDAEYPIYVLGDGSNTPIITETVVGDYSIYQVTAVGIIALIGGIAVTSVLSTEYGKYSLFKLVLPFYTRVKKEEVLNHEVRELVYDYVQSHPGEHFRAILTKLGLTNGTLIHHLQTLERQNFIKSERDGPFKRFYPTGRNLTEDVLEINGIQMKILDTVKDNPGITQKDLARMLDTSPPTINYHVKALNMVRLLNLKRDGKNTRCFPGQSLNGWYKSGVA